MAFRVQEQPTAEGYNMQITTNRSVLAATSYVYGGTTDVVFDDVDQGSLQIVYTSTIPAAKTFTDTDVTVLPNSIAIDAHGFVTGLKVSIAIASGGTLPAGLTATDYWIIKMSAGVIKFAATLADALAGTAVAITDVGTHHVTTITAAALAGCVCKLQATNDGTNYFDISGLTKTITAAGNEIFPLVDKFYKALRINLAITAGEVTLSASLFGKKYANM